MPTKIAVVHNLPPGAWRRLSNQISGFQNPVVEICLETATPITDHAVVVPLRLVSSQVPRLLRPPLRYLDMVMLETAWRRVAEHILASRADVVYMNPCRYLQAPPIVHKGVPPVVYFCDEARRVDVEPEAAATRNSKTMFVYRPLYARQRHLDRYTATHVDVIATNSRYSACAIERAYGRRASVVRMGVAETLMNSGGRSRNGNFLLSVGSLIPSKGHDLVMRASAASAAKLPVFVVAPRRDSDERARLASLAGALGVRLEVRVAISDQELAGLYGDALATVYLASNEPLGLVSLEAQACGCPVIVAAEGGLPETIVENETGWSVCRDPAVVAGLVDRLADVELYERMSRAARTHGSSLTWKASAAEVEELLKSAAAQEFSSDGQSQSNLP